METESQNESNFESASGAPTLGVLSILFKMNKVLSTAVFSDGPKPFELVTQLPNLQSEAVQALLAFAQMHFGLLIYGNMGLSLLSGTLQRWLGGVSSEWLAVLQLQRSNHSLAESELVGERIFRDKETLFLDAELAVHLAKRVLVAERNEELSLGLACFEGVYSRPEVLLAQNELRLMLQEDPFLAFAWRAEALAFGQRPQLYSLRISSSETDGQARALAAVCLLLLPIDGFGKNILGEQLPCELPRLLRKIERVREIVAIPLFLKQEILALELHLNALMPENRSLEFLFGRAKTLDLVYQLQGKKWGLTKYGLCVLKPYRKMLEEEMF